MADEEVALRKLREKLSTPEGVQEALINLTREITQIKGNFQEEAQLRFDLEKAVETELSELNRRLLLEVGAREQQREDIRSGTQIKQSLVGELDVLKTKLQFLVELIAPPVSRGKGKELFDLLSLTEEMEGQLMEMNDLLNLEMSNVSLTRNIREIKDKIAAEHNERLELEKKNWQLELALNNIKEALEEESQEMEQIQRSLQAEVSARKNLEAQFNQN